MVTDGALHAEPGDNLTASFFLPGNGNVERQKIRLMRSAGHVGGFEYAMLFSELPGGNAKLLESYLAFYDKWSP
ncbi:MAG: hypothetical protein HY280_04140 [Nitrospinae bacterium]|nr:hypothetical protein [Nitrospinota bacterium]